MDETGVYIDNVLSLRDVRLSTIKLAADSGSALIELLEFGSHREGMPAKREVYSVGPSHVALTVDDLDGLYRRLSQAGVRFKAPPHVSPDGGAKVTFCHDPDGTFVELVEVLTPVGPLLSGGVDQK